MSDVSSALCFQQPQHQEGQPAGSCFTLHHGNLIGLRSAESGEVAGGKQRCLLSCCGLCPRCLLSSRLPVSLSAAADSPSSDIPGCHLRAPQSPPTASAGEWTQTEESCRRSDLRAAQWDLESNACHFLSFGLIEPVNLDQTSTPLIRT